MAWQKQYSIRRKALFTRKLEVSVRKQLVRGDIRNISL
jgi:hypothetical protein